MSQQDMDRLERCITDLKKLSAQMNEKQAELGNIIAELSVGNRMYQSILGSICGLMMHGDDVNIKFDISKDSKGVQSLYMEMFEGDDDVKAPQI